MGCAGSGALRARGELHSGVGWRAGCWVLLCRAQTCRGVVALCHLSVDRGSGEGYAKARIGTATCRSHMALSYQVSKFGSGVGCIPLNIVSDSAFDIGVFLAKVS